MARNEALANPQLLEWARRTAGYTPADAARRAHVSPHQLQEWEAGESRPTLAKLRDLADLYKRPLAVFYLEQAPPDDPLLPDFRRRPATAISGFSPALRLAIRIARVRRAEALELYQDLGAEPVAFSLSARLQDNPETVAGVLRRVLTAVGEPPSGDPRAAFNYWRGAAEACGVLVFQAEDVRPEEMSGFSLSERPLPAVVLNIKEAYAARSFSLCHELAHIMLGQNGVCDLHESGMADQRRTEVFCNHVAGAVLMPATQVLEQAETPRSQAASVPDEVVVALSKRFGVSREAAVRRLVILNCVSPSFYRRKRQQLLREYEARAGRRKPGFAPPPAMAIARSGPLFTRLVLEAFDDERITASDVSRFLGMKLKHLDQVRQKIHATPEGSAGVP